MRSRRLPAARGKRILVVDDNATNREIVSRHARSWGMEPVAVGVPAEALALVAAGERVRRRVLDMMMPEMDGVALAREIRRYGERELPLRAPDLARSAAAGAPRRGVRAQLAKPLKASQLYNALLACSAGRRRRGGARAGLGTRDAATARPLRILLAEDNAVNQKVALSLLERLGYGADVASNGLEALEALERQRTTSS